MRSQIEGLREVHNDGRSIDCRYLSSYGGSQDHEGSPHTSIAMLYCEYTSTLEDIYEVETLSAMLMSFVTFL